MTAGAVLLQVVQPKSGPAPELAAVKQQWQSIQVEPAQLDGQVDPNQTHFFVDREGHWDPTESWKAQKHLGQPGIIHIALQRSARSNKVTEPQWHTTQWLMGVLEQKCSIPNRRVVMSKALTVPNQTPARQQAGIRQSSSQSGSSRAR